MITRLLYLAGEWTRGLGTSLRVIDPTSAKVFAEVDTPSPQQIDIAAELAAEAASELRCASGPVRAGWLRKLAAGLRDADASFAELESRNVGKPLAEAQIDVEDSIQCLHHYADLADALDAEQRQIIAEPLADFSISVRREPVGVAALIIPWNFPLLTAVWKLAPALAAGCPCIMKPSEFTPLTALALAELADNCGLPAGSLSILTGEGPSVGEPLCRHPLVRKISFTGSTATGRKIAAIAAADYKRTTIEAGGKSPLVIFRDVQVASAVEWIMFGGLYNQGQVCNATTRVLMEESIYSEILERLTHRMERLVIGPPQAPGVQMGPLQNRPQYEKFLRYVELGKAQGASLLFGGEKHPDHSDGFFVQPAIFADVPPEAAIWSEEVFGPLLACRPFSTEEEAIRVANESPYGLAAAVLTEDPERADRVAAAIDAGCVWQNCNGLAFVQGPWGGFKQSGVGRELGRWGLEAFQEVKQVTRYRGRAPWNWYLK